MSFPNVLTHDPIEQIADDVFMVSGSVKLNALLQFSRNMVIVRSNNELTLINPVRLKDSELRKLDELGEVKHLLRLGAFHGMDDPFYMDRYDAAFWCQPGGTTYTQPPIDHELSEGGPLPFNDATLFCFKGTLEPECALLLPQAGNLLLTCDAIQNYGDYRNFNFLAKIISPLVGFPKKTIIGPFWVKLMTPDGQSLKDEFARLLSHPFDRLLAAHGTLLDQGAHQAVEDAFAKMYPN